MVSPAQKVLQRGFPSRRASMRNWIMVPAQRFYNTELMVTVPSSVSRLTHPLIGLSGDLEDLLQEAPVGPQVDGLGLGLELDHQLAVAFWPWRGPAPTRRR